MPDAPVRSFTIHIPGPPRGQGRPRFNANGRPYTTKEDRTYRRAITTAWRTQGSPRLPHDCMYTLRVTAHMARPKDHFTQTGLSAKGRRSAHPTRLPDVDNVLKAIADALAGVAFPDDARMIRAKVEKRWSDEDTEGVTVTAQEIP